MPCRITTSCISCGDCKAPCPRAAIDEGPDIYEIDQTKCNNCEGYYKSPRCMELCPEQNAIVYSPPQQ